MHCKKSELKGGGSNSKKRAFCRCIFPRVRGGSDSYFRCWFCSYFTAFTPTPDFASPLVTVTDTETFDLKPDRLTIQRDFLMEISKLELIFFLSTTGPQQIHLICLVVKQRFQPNEVEFLW